MKRQSATAHPREVLEGTGSIHQETTLRRPRVPGCLAATILGVAQEQMGRHTGSLEAGPATTHDAQFGCSISKPG